MFQVESGLATQVASALGVPIGADQRQQLAEQPTRNADAYGAYLQGEARRSGANPVVLRQRVQYYARALTSISNFGLAWAALSVAIRLFYDGYSHRRRSDCGGDALSGAEALIAEQPCRPRSPSRPTSWVCTRIRCARATQPNRTRHLPIQCGAAVHRRLVGAISGRWERGAQARPRGAAHRSAGSVRARDALATTLLYLRHYRDARDGYERALSLDPQATGLYEFLTLANLGLATPAPCTTRSAVLSKYQGSAQVLAFFAGNNELFWVLNDADQRLLLRRHHDAFDGDRGAWQSFEPKPIGCGATQGVRAKSPTLPGSSSPTNCANHRTMAHAFDAWPVARVPRP